MFWAELCQVVARLVDLSTVQYQSNQYDDINKAVRIGYIKWNNFTPVRYV